MYQIQVYCESPICPIRATYPTDFILLDVVAPATFAEKYKILIISFALQ